MDHSAVRIEVIRILVLVQGAVTVVAAMQVALMGLVLGAPLGLLVLLGVVAAVITLGLASGVARWSRRARRLLVIVQLMWLAMALIDLLLALFLA